jgi:hypothetical protein
MHVICHCHFWFHMCGCGDNSHKVCHHGTSRPFHDALQPVAQHTITFSTTRHQQPTKLLLLQHNRLQGASLEGCCCLCSAWHTIQGCSLPGYPPSSFDDLLHLCRGKLLSICSSCTVKQQQFSAVRPDTQPQCNRHCCMDILLVLLLPARILQRASHHKPSFGLRGLHGSEGQAYLTPQLRCLGP